MKILRPSDYRVMPWKNGGGTTTEIMIWPQGADVSFGFNWRVSMADVASDGPFSAFPNYRRALLVLAGNGLTLSTAGSSDITLRPGDEAFDFDGATPISARLVDGPVGDFNVMCRNRNCFGRLRGETLTRRSGLRLAAAFELLFAHKGSFLADGSLVEEGGTVVTTRGEMPELEATPEAEVVIATIWDDGAGGATAR